VPFFSLNPSIRFFFQRDLFFPKCSFFFLSRPVSPLLFPLVLPVRVGFFFFFALESSQSPPFFAFFPVSYPLFLFPFFSFVLIFTYFFFVPQFPPQLGLSPFFYDLLQQRTPLHSTFSFFFCSPLCFSKSPPSFLFPSFFFCHLSSGHDSPPFLREYCSVLPPGPPYPPQFSFQYPYCWPFGRPPHIVVGVFRSIPPFVPFPPLFVLASHFPPLPPNPYVPSWRFRSPLFK